MTYFKVNGRGVFKYQKHAFESVLFLRSLPFVRLSSSSSLANEELNRSDQKKLLKVAIVGRPNAGKSTLINKILNLNLCGVSCKSHTTRTTQKASFTHGETQIVFLDTPGLVTQKEFARFKLSDKFLTWKKHTLEEADIIGVIHEVVEPRSIFKLHLNLAQNIHDLPQSKPAFLIFNKIDLVLDKDAFSAAVNSFFEPRNLEQPNLNKQPKFLQRFSQIFFISALRNRGVDEIVNYLLEQAKPGQWLFEPSKVLDKPLDVLVVDLLRAQLLDILPGEIPYECKYEVEYLKENDLGEILCVGLVTCRHSRHAHLITSGKKRSLRSICQQLESDLYKILGKVFKIRLVVKGPK